MRFGIILAGLLGIAAMPAAAQHLSAPENLVLTPGGQLLVANGGSHEIVSFQTDGSYVGRFATATGRPRWLALDKAQALFVGMTNSPDVSVFNTSGALLRMLHGAGGVGLAVTGNDTLVSLQTSGLRLFNKKGVQTQTIAQDKQGRPYLGGVALVVGTAMYYVSGPVTGPSIADTVSVASLLAGLPREREHFTNTGSSAPTQVAVDGLGHYYLAGAGGTVTVYSHFGAVLLTLPGLTTPSGIAVDPNGAIYVAERDANDVRVFDAAGHPVTTIR